jgi:hypothetical protein
MPLPESYPLNEVIVSAYLPDLSTASSAYAVSPVRGRIVEAWSVIQGTVPTTLDCTWSLEINNVAVTGSTATVTVSGAAAGDVDVSTPTALNFVNEGDTIEWRSLGESSATVPVMFYARIRIS